MRSLILLTLIPISFLPAGTISTAGASNGTAVDVQGITGFSTLGSQMDGLIVTATFASGAVSSCTWSATSATAGGCSTALFTMSLDGDTFSSPWVLGVSPGGSLITALLFDGVGGGSGTLLSGTVFDRTFGSAGTPGTSSGADASGTTVGGDGSAAYQDIITILGGATAGDIYGRVNIRFGDGISSANFVMDTDTVGLPANAPEPSTWAMFGGALVSLGLWRRRRNG